MKIRLLIVDDKSSIRDALQSLFNGVPDIEVIEAKEDAIDVSKFIRKNKIDLVFMDIDMPGINGIDAVNNIRKNGLDVPVIMLTVFEDEDKIFNSIKAGANGYLLKNTQPRKIIESVRDVYNGGASFTPLIAKKVLNYFQTPKPKTNDYNLSKREKEVLYQLVDGNPYKVIADKLNISYETVRSHMKKIYTKIHVSSLTEAVAKTIKEDLLNN